MKQYDTLLQRNILIEVDPQNDFIGGALGGERRREVIEPLNQLARAVRRSLGTVAITRDQHPETTPHFDLWGRHCVAGTWGAAFHEELEVLPNDLIINKGMGQLDGYSGFEGVSEDGQTLEALIRPRGSEIVRVFLGGIAVDYCVKATAVDGAMLFGGHPSVTIYGVRDAMRAVNLEPGDEAAAIRDMSQAGVQFLTLEQALAMIDTTRLEK